MNPFLSIVIPTYNRLEILIDNLKKILAYKENDIEIIIQDDCSTEPINEAVEELSDKRIKVFKNKQHLNIDNYYYSLKSGRGEYLWLISYRDTVMPENISTCINLLKKSVPDLLAVSGKNCANYKDSLTTGYEAIRRNYAVFMYGTGIVYKRDKINFNKYTSCVGYETWLLYPQTFLANDIIKHGKIQTTSLQLFERVDYPSSDKLSWAIKGKPYYPEIPARLHLHKLLCYDLQKEKLNEAQRVFFVLLLTCRFIGWEITYISFIQNLNQNQRLSKELKFKLNEHFVNHSIYSLIILLPWKVYKRGGRILKMKCRYIWSNKHCLRVFVSLICQHIRLCKVCLSVHKMKTLIERGDKQ